MQVDVTKYTHIAVKLWHHHQQRQWQLHKVWFNQTGEIEPLYDIIYNSVMIYLECDARGQWLEFIPLRATPPLRESNLESRLKRKKNLYNITTCLYICVCSCESFCLRATVSFTFLPFFVPFLHIGRSCCKFTMLYLICIIFNTFFLSHSFIVGSMSSLCCLKMQSMKVFLPHPLKVKPNLSRATLSCSVKSKNQAHIS